MKMRMVLFALLKVVLGSSHACAGDGNDSDAPQCIGVGSALLQRNTRAHKVNSKRDSDDDGTHATLTATDAARFLMQATFGPTNSSVHDLTLKSYVTWIEEQMSLNVSSHREYYRSRANPHWDAVKMLGYVESKPCAKGSRWQNYAISSADKNKVIAVVNGAILVENEWRSDIDPHFIGNALPPPSICVDTVVNAKTQSGKTASCDKKRDALVWNCGKDDWIDEKACRASCFENGYAYDGDDCSEGWPNASKELVSTTYICGVSDRVGGPITLSTDSSCKKGKFKKLNPAIWLEGDGNATEVTNVTYSSALPGVFFLKEDVPNCSLKEDSLITWGGKYYMYDARLALVGNTVENPSALVRTRKDPDKQACIQKTFINAKGCRVQLPEDISAGGCALLCGSPGEIASMPENGHMLPMRTLGEPEADQRNTGNWDPDNNFDNPPLYDFGDSRSKNIVWTMLAFDAEDQLRQRMAFALSEIFVAAANLKGKRDNEYWVNFYDVFMRNAFGNFRDVLREVTYSAVMGRYLSYRKNHDFDSSGNYPDENYAREIMQLFTIGLYELNGNGSMIIDEDSQKPKETYTNENVMSFARVFTGFDRPPSRFNFEMIKHSDQNYVDPMTMDGTVHDRHPKHDLHGNFLGDGYPLCADLPRNSHLAAGAMYEFVGYDLTDEATVLSGNSNLSLALASSPTSHTIELQSKLECTTGIECDVDVVDLFQVGRAFYQFVPPTCVYLYFYEGKIANSGDNGNEKQVVCADQSLPIAAPVCCSGKPECTNLVRGKDRKKGKTCDDMDQKICARSSFQNNGYCRTSCWQKYEEGPFNCSVGMYKESMLCDSLHDRTTYAGAVSRCADSDASVCAEVLYGKCGAGSSIFFWTAATCKPTVHVHEYGVVSAGTAEGLPDSFAVSWANDVYPTEGKYEANVAIQTVFSNLTEVPDKTTLMQRLKVGAHVPTSSCTHNCADGGVKIYSADNLSNDFDADTVFEIDGQFFKNVESIVKVQDVEGYEFSFRNPPVFTQPGIKLHPRIRERAALAEVESLIDHLFYHNNTKTTIGRQLIQRFVSSNPSPEYISAVGEAFRSGSYKDDAGQEHGMERYGCLRATLFAMLLHPEARTQNTSTNGMLREPLLKVIHFMRSMQYKHIDSLIVLNNVLGSIGQWPYWSPSVFNFFRPDYTPPNFPSDKGVLVGPEFEIFIAPYSIGFLNEMQELIRYGFSKCDDGWGLGKGHTAERCVEGKLELPDSGKSATVAQLDLLLTGGRMTPQNLEIVGDVYEKAKNGEKLQEAQNAMLFMPEFHNLGNSEESTHEESTQGGSTHEEPFGNSEESTHEEPASPTSYRAMVLLFMQGGADTFQMLVPTGCSLYNEYVARRGKVLAFNQSDVRPIVAESQRCRDFGIHPAFEFLHSLYLGGEAAFVSNIGNLVAPVNRSSLPGSTKTCANMFSHQHQQAAAQTLKCQVAGNSPRGIGGRMVDQLAYQNYTATSFSLDGINTWSTGFETAVEMISPNAGVRTLDKYKDRSWKKIITNITHQKHDNVYFHEYVESLDANIESTEHLSKKLGKVKLNTSYVTTSGLQQQLYQVARLITAQEDRKSERDIFFVRIGGFDTHKDIIEDLQIGFDTVDKAIQGFVAELKTNETIWNNTVIVSSSEFGRTMSFNGQGTDHGWGGNQFVIGGGINGGQIFNDFIETYVEGNSMELTRGRVIPKYPWESVMKPIAEWMGVDFNSDGSNNLFHNLGNFKPDTSEFIIPKDALFKPDS